MRAALAGLLAIGCIVTGCVETPSSAPSSASPSVSKSTSTPTSVTARTERSRRWDPRDVDDLPSAPDDVAPLLPAVIEPPVSARPLAEAPVRAALLTVSRRRTVLVLAVDGSWRSIPVPERYAQASLSRSGTRLLFTKDSSVDVWDLTTGARTTIPFPERLVPWDFTRSKWVDETTFLIDDYRGGWLIDVTDCSARRVPYPTEFAWAVDTDGVPVESADYEGPMRFTDWASGRPRHLRMGSIGHLARLVATSESVIGTTYDNGPFRVVVADRSNLQPTAVLPMYDHEANYSNWGLGPVATQRDGTVILWVAALGKIHGWRLVAWDPDSGDLSLVSRSDAEPTDPLSYALDLLR